MFHDHEGRPFETYRALRVTKGKVSGSVRVGYRASLLFLPEPTLAIKPSKINGNFYFRFVPRFTPLLLSLLFLRKETHAIDIVDD